MMNCEQGEHQIEKGATIVVTQEGMFCSQGCADEALKDSIREEMMEDADSWYFLDDEGNTRDWDKVWAW